MSVTKICHSAAIPSQGKPNTDKKKKQYSYRHINQFDGVNKILISLFELREDQQKN